MEELGRRTPGFTGADLANLVNTAAHIALRHSATEITQDHFDEALATILLGPVRKSAVVAARDRIITAWHETGHALLGLWVSEAADPVQVTILPRAGAGGATWFPAIDDMFLSRRQAEAQLVVAMGGRVAEEIILDDDYTQGASQDFKVAAGLAEHMVTEFGMSSLGPGYIDAHDARFGYLAERVHLAKQELLDGALTRARDLLVPARPILEKVVEVLLEEETLDTDALLQIAGRNPLSLGGPSTPAQADQFAPRAEDRSE
jgi:cell division protease FtsH